MEVEREAVDRFNRGIALAVELGDNGTRELLAGMLTSEEEHVECSYPEALEDEDTDEYELRIARALASALID